MSDDWTTRVDDAFDAQSEATASQHERFTAELERTLGQPTLVTDAADGVTRPTWTIEMPDDELERLCAEHNARLGRFLDDSEGGLTD
jgi:hypothetical protein